MKTVGFTMYPYVLQECTIKVPDNVEVDENYINAHWKNIDFGEPNFDYAGCDMAIYHKEVKNEGTYGTIQEDAGL